jgi:hypothetical protein
MDNPKVPQPTCTNCLKTCKADTECEEHVFAPGVLPFGQTKADVVGERIQYEGCWWNGTEEMDYRSQEIFIVCKAHEIFGCSETTKSA